MKKLLLLCFLASSLLFGQNPDIGIQVFATGFNGPLDIQNAGDDRLFVVQQSGAIRIVNPDGSINGTPFITINVNDNGNEQGLLGLAFHPDYATNGFFYVNYTLPNEDTRISRYSVSSGDPDIADPNSEFVILEVDQPFSNHNGGALAFGPDDGFLYIALGDGGSGGDPMNFAQNPQSLLGKMLRIDIDNQDTGLNYSIPASNPFVGDSSFRGEIWDYGLRNPFRFSFDPPTGSMWIGDVGQNAVEEINNGIDGGHNYGWRCYEGSDPFNTGGCPSQSELTFPVAEYDQSASGQPFRCSVIGGFVYRGTEFPTMQNLYFFADLCSNDIGYIDATNPAGITFSDQFNGNAFVSFGVDQNDELYIVGIGSGTLYRVVDNNLLGIEDQIQKPEFTLFPNPAQDILEIRVSDLVDASDELSIFDITGKLIQSMILTDVQTTINLSDFRAGVYFVQLANSGITQKLIIQ